VSCRRFSRWCERVELPLKVTTLDVVAPLAVALDGDVVVFAITIAVEFELEVSCRDTPSLCVQWTVHVLHMAHVPLRAHELLSTCTSAHLMVIEVVVAVLFEVAC
jgi:hypothetical protein